MPWPMILPPGLPVVEGTSPTVIILLAHSAVYVAGGGDIIDILSPRVLGVWGTGRLSDKMRGFRIIFGIRAFTKWIEGIIGIYIVKILGNDYRFLHSIQVLAIVFKSKTEKILN